MNKKKVTTGVILGLIVFWLALHIPGIMYGTKQLPLHQSYIGDEQSPVNGALHILEDKSLLGLRNVSTLYYGPVFSLVILPAVLIDAGIHYISGAVRSAEDYKNFILYDWGGIVIWGRIIAVLFSLFGLLAVYKFLEGEKNRYGFNTAALIGTGLLAVNFYFFEYSHFIKHWIFIVTALLIELWTLRRIVEGCGSKWWILHALAALFAAGISIISLGYLVMWIPVLVKWLRASETAQLRRFARLVYSIIIGVLLIVLWHPYVITRYLGFLGLGGDFGGGLGDTQNPLGVGAGSADYYGTLIGLNHLPLIIVLLVFFVTLWKTRIWAKWQVWAITLPGILNLLLFVPAEHHEGRYMLPTIVCMIVLVGYLYGEYVRKPQGRVSKIIIGTLLVSYVLFHMVHIGKWIDVYSRGPVEESTIEKVLQNAASGKQRTLFVQAYIMGYPHTKEAYTTYMKDFNKGGINLYSEILKAPDPTSAPLLDATYITLGQYEKDTAITEKFDQVWVRHEPRVELNQFDYIDENITRVWWYDELMPQYSRIK